MSRHQEKEWPFWGMSNGHITSYASENLLILHLETEKEVISAQFQSNWLQTFHSISFQELSPVKLHIYARTDNTLSKTRQASRQLSLFSVSLSIPSTWASVRQLHKSLTLYLAGVWCDMISPLQNSESHSAKLSHAPSATGVFWAWTQILSDYLWKQSLAWKCVICPPTL